MTLRCKHICLTLLLFIATGVCFAGSPLTKVQNLQEQNTSVIPVLLVEFQDVKFSAEDPAGEFNALFNGTGYSRNGSHGSVREYFNANFRGIRTFEFPVAAKVTLDKPISQYGAPSASFNDTDVKQLLADACNEAMAQGINFNTYDPDNDGIIENIAIVFAGYSESEGGDRNSIWAHRQDLAPDGFRIGELQVLSYTCTAELKGSSGTTISPIGTICHELCHYLGLPDMYDTNGETEGLSAALYGTLSIMDRGNHSNNGNTPPYFTSIEREILGIGEIEDLVPGKSYTLDPVGLSGKIYRIKCSVEGEYFLLECRNPQGWDKYIGGEGLVVYHVDKSGMVHGGIQSLQRWKFNNINSFSEHPCAVVLPAAEVTSGNSSLFFPGSGNATSLSCEKGYVQLKEWSGEGTGTALENIRFSNGKVMFRTVEDFSYNDTLPIVIDCRAVPYQHDARIVWKDLPAPRNGENKGAWLVKWMGKDGEDEGSIITDSTTVLIDGLQPGQQYNIQVRFISGMELGRKFELKLKTHQINSPYPYIHIGQQEYRCGETMDLRVFNLQEPHLAIEWYINGKKTENAAVIFENSGPVELQATIRYYDGSEERIYKEIFIE